MKILICGSRGKFAPEIIERAVQKSGFKITEVISGGASGIDTLAENWARQNKLPFHLFKPDWGTHGKPAGILRNIQMVNFADGVIAIWDGVSKGTKSSIDYANRAGKPLFVMESETKTANDIPTTRK